MGNNKNPHVKSQVKPRKKFKTSLVFDPEKRREFLSGFHKRKVLRKKKAQDEFATQLKEERKRLKLETRESYKKLVVSHRDIPEVEHLLDEEYETEDVSVKIVELSTADMAIQNNWIGVNAPLYDGDEIADSNSESETEEIPGMAIKAKPPRKKVVDKSPLTEFSNQKELKKVLKKQAAKSLKNSKPFQKKGKLEQQKNKKISLKQKTKRIKTYSKKDKYRRNKMGAES